MIPNFEDNLFAIVIAVDCHFIEITLSKREVVSCWQEASSAFLSDESTDFEILVNIIVFHRLTIQNHDASDVHRILETTDRGPVSFSGHGRQGNGLEVGCVGTFIVIIDSNGDFRLIHIDWIIATTTSVVILVEFSADELQVFIGAATNGNVVNQFVILVCPIHTVRSGECSGC